MIKFETSTNGMASYIDNKGRIKSDVKKYKEDLSERSERLNNLRGVIKMLLENDEKLNKTQRNKRLMTLIEKLTEKSKNEILTEGMGMSYNLGKKEISFYIYRGETYYRIYEFYIDLNSDETISGQLENIQKSINKYIDKNTERTRNIDEAIKVAERLDKQLTEAKEEISNLGFDLSSYNTSLMAY